MSRSYGRGRGFTLIELLVVLVILGTLVSLAVLSVGNGAGRALRDEGDRLHSRKLRAFNEPPFR